MRRATVIFLFVLMFSPLLYAAEKGQPVFDERSWKLGWSQNKGEAVFEEYVLEGESVQNWSELVTVQFFPGLQDRVSLEMFETRQKIDLSGICTSLTWKSVYQSADERVWQWSITGCSGQADQSEIARLKRTAAGFHLWHYAIKKAPMPEGKEALWREKLMAIEVRKIK